MAEKEDAQATADNQDSDREKSISSENSTNVTVTNDKVKGKEVMVVEEKGRGKKLNEFGEKAEGNTLRRDVMKPVLGQIRFAKRKVVIKDSKPELGYKSKSCRMRASNDPELLLEKKAAKIVKRKKTAARKARNNNKEVKKDVSLSKGKGKDVIVVEEKAKGKKPTEVAEKAKENKVMGDAMKPLVGRFAKRKVVFKDAPPEPGYKPKCCRMNASNNNEALLDEIETERKAKRTKSTPRKVQTENNEVKKDVSLSKGIGKKYTKVLEEAKGNKVMGIAMEPLVGRSVKRKSVLKDAPPEPGYKPLSCRMQALNNQAALLNETDVIQAAKKAKRKNPAPRKLITDSNGVMRYVSSLSGSGDGKKGNDGIESAKKGKGDKSAAEKGEETNGNAENVKERGNSKRARCKGKDLENT